jgi:hypothetical protein
VLTKGRVHQGDVGDPATGGLASAAFGLHATLLGMTVLGVEASLLVASMRSVRMLPRQSTDR